MVRGIEEDHDSSTLTVRVRSRLAATKPYKHHQILTFLSFSRVSTGARLLGTAPGLAGFPDKTPLNYNNMRQERILAIAWSEKLFAHCSAT